MSTQNSTLFLEILFTDEVQPDDLEFIRLASRKTPGRARLDKARIGQAHPDAPNSVGFRQSEFRAVFSHTGLKIGFVAGEDMIEAPYTYTYQLLEGVAQ
jgi:hypothetical protein